MARRKEKHQEPAREIPKKKILFYDTEYTGTADNGELTQLCLLDGTGCIVYASYFRPVGRKQWPSAKRPDHVISLEMVENQPTFAAEKEHILEMFNNAERIASFTTGGEEEQLLNRLGIVIPPEKKFDILASYRSHLAEGGHRLKTKPTPTDMAKHFGFHFESHDAMADAMAALRCYNSFADGCDRCLPLEGETEKEEKPHRRQHHVSRRFLPGLLLAVVCITVLVILEGLPFKALAFDMATLQKLYDAMPGNYVALGLKIAAALGVLLMLESTVSFLYRLLCTVLQLFRPKR